MKTLKLPKTNYLNLLFDYSLKQGSKSSSFTIINFFTGALLMILILTGCSKDDVDPVDENEPEIISKVDVELPTDPGEVGLVVDVREIFRKGFIATEARVTFPEHSSFDETLAIDPVTNLAILRISNEDLTEEQKDAFAEGIATEIIIYDQDQNVLEEYQSEETILDASGDPLKLQTDLDYVAPPLIIKEGVEYLLQAEGEDNVLTATCSSCFVHASFNSDTDRQKFKFTPVVGEPDTYFIELEYQYADPDDNGTGTIFHVGQPYIDIYKNSNWIFLMNKNRVSGDKFTIEQEEDGWVLIRWKNKDKYLAADQGDLKLYNKEDADRFRLISGAIEWSVEDKGTVYHQPIMPAAEIDFAYEATIRNCTSGTLTEIVGNTQTRTATQSISSSEGFELFGSATATVGLTVGAEVGGEVYGGTASVEASASLSLTASATKSHNKTLSSQNEVEVGVSRSRSLEVPPFTGVEVFDAVRSVKDARIPFTQVLRITARYKNEDALTGDEIITQMMFNLVEGVPIEIGDHYVDVSLRGNIDIDQMFEVETGANELPGACD